MSQQSPSAFLSNRRYVPRPLLLLSTLSLALSLAAAGQQASVSQIDWSTAKQANPATQSSQSTQPLLSRLGAAGRPLEPSDSGGEAFQQTALANGQQPPGAAYPDSFWGRYQARVTATQNDQPHWITPLATVTPRLEQEVRTDFVHYHNTTGHEIWNYGNSKGLEFIPEKHTELLVNVPPFFDRSNGESDGFGDMSFLLKERIYSRNEERGNAIVTAFLGATLPTGKNGNGSCCATVTPTLAVGKGFGNFDVTSTAGGSLPVTNVKGLGRSVLWNNVAQYRLAKAGLARFFWPEFEVNSTFFKGGSNDGKSQAFGTPGIITGRVPLTHDAAGRPGRLGLTFGAGEQIAMTHFHTANHYTVITVRIPF